LNANHSARLLAATIIGAATLTLAAATPVSASAAQNAVCLDTTNSRANNTNVRLWQCINHPNQKWVIQNGQIKVEDTLS
jgi:hypothetical protein